VVLHVNRLAPAWLLCHSPQEQQVSHTSFLAVSLHNLRLHLQQKCESVHGVLLHAHCRLGLLVATMKTTSMHKFISLLHMRLFTLVEHISTVSAAAPAFKRHHF
jgi:hypothetical protein